MIFALLGAWTYSISARQPLPFVHGYFTWIESGNLRADYALYYDRLTLVMTVTVTVVAFLIHLYSRGYMEHEGGYYRFFTYLNLFLFMMLTLVTAANYPLMFVGWEGVGLAAFICSSAFISASSQLPTLGRRHSSSPASVTRASPWEWPCSSGRFIR